MYVICGSLAGLLLYLEIVYHLSGFGFSGCNPVYTLALILAWSGIQTMLVGVLKGRWKKLAYYSFLWIAVIWYSVQLVYLRIFKQPLLWEAVFRGGGDALSNYWREALEGILGAIPIILLFLLPAIVLGVVLHKSKWQFPNFSGRQLLITGLFGVTGIAAGLVTMEVGRYLEADYYEEYSEFYDPLGVAENMGVLPLFQRDTMQSVARLAENVWLEMVEKPEAAMAPVGGALAGGNGSGQDGDNANAPQSGTAKEEGKNADASKGVEDAQEQEQSQESTKHSQESETVEDGRESSQETSSSESDDEPTEENDTDNESSEREPVASIIRPQQYDIDFELLHSLADNEKQTWLADYIEGLTPTTTNEYTGSFEGYNLIYLTAEGFSTYAIREDLTPTLYRLANTGFVFENYYVPLWQTSTSDGEYINCTGLIPDGQFSMRKSGSNDMAYTLPRFFAQEGVNSYAYHNNTLSYYDRYLTHPNLGYDFKGCKLGSLSESEWRKQIFPMEHPDSWPASDLEMLQGTVSEYVNEERFHVYYMTVSGHMNYNFKGNAMAAKNKEAVAGLELSEEARAYLACNIELDKALEYLLEQLEETGQLEKTVICMSADHYPYGLTDEQYEELAGRSLAENKDMYRNSLILWNVGMEEEPVFIDKACGSMDIVPTLLNLFGFDYDSRMYAGRDILSEEEGMVIFNDRSFVTDGLIYNRKGKVCTWLQDAEGNDIVPDGQKEAYLEEKQQEVKDRYQFSAYILQENYYADIEQAVGEETDAAQ